MFLGKKECEKKRGKMEHVEMAVKKITLEREAETDVMSMHPGLSPVNE